jgi:hypothetical protein
MTKLSRKKIEAYYTALGRFVTIWGEVEQYLDLLVIVVAKPDLPRLFRRPRAACYTGYM